MLIKNTYSIITKKYPLRLKLARKGLIQFFIQKDVSDHHEDAFLFNKIELMNIIYTNIWFALEGFIDVTHNLFSIDGLDENNTPKELAKKLSEIKEIINKSCPNLIHYQNQENIRHFMRESLQLTHSLTRLNGVI